MELIRRAQDFGLLFFFLALLVLEGWYVAWLRRLPALLAPEQLSTFSLFIAVPPWFGKMAWGGVVLCVTGLGREIARSAFSLVAFFRGKRGAAATINAHRVVVIDQLATGAVWAMATGTYIFLILNELQYFG